MFSTNKKDRSSNGLTVEDIVRRSSQASCGLTEREVTVKSENVASTIKKLKARGFFVVGVSHGNSRTKKVWFAKTPLL